MRASKRSVRLHASANAPRIPQTALLLDSHMHRRASEKHHRLNTSRGGPDRATSQVGALARLHAPFCFPFRTACVFLFSLFLCAALLSVSYSAFLLFFVSVLGLVRSRERAREREAPAPAFASVSLAALPFALPPHLRLVLAASFLCLTPCTSARAGCESEREEGEVSDGRASRRHMRPVLVRVLASLAGLVCHACLVLRSRPWPPATSTR